jgi:methylated-DNA-protein-cysteine methyltransferase-like protein
LIDLDIEQTFVYIIDMKYLSPPDQAEFRKQVWEIVRQIPPGKVTTYGQIAAFIPPPRGMSPQDYAAWGSRWVGGAMAACPDDIPWQRVINSQGKISLRPGSGAVTQRQMLEEEGVSFDARERVDLKYFGWAGPSLEWLQAHGLVSPGGR